MTNYQTSQIFQPRRVPNQHDMTPGRFHECLFVLDWSQRGLAAQIGVHDSSVRRWASGRYPIPEPIAAWLETLAQFHEAHPAPIAPSGSA